jgi:hypothetical protein
VPPGRALSPADIAVIRRALADAQWHQAQHGTVGRAATYGAVLGQIAAAGREEYL